MSSKRCILIALALWAVVLSAQMTSWVYCSGYHFKNAMNEHLTGYDLNKIVYIPLGAYNLEFENRFVYTDRMQDDRQDRLTIKPQLSLSRKWDNGFAKIWYRGEFFDKNIGRGFFDNETNPLYAKRTYNQQVGGKLTFEDEFFYGNVASRHRTFFYNSLIDTEPTTLQTNNINTSFTAGFRVIKPVSFFLTGTNKQALDEKSDLYDFASGGMGLTFDNPLLSFGYLSANSRIEWLTGKHLSLDLDTLTYMHVQNSQRLLPVTSEMRYTVMATPQLMGYLSYANRSFYDRENREMLFNSQFLRASCKYTYNYDQSSASFTEIGGKYSPQDIVKHQSSVLFAKSEMKVIKRLYLGAGINHTPERLTRYEGIIRYFLMPWNEIFIDYIYTDDIDLDNFTTYTSAGVRLMF
jgi:hypothetical protein